MFFVASCGDESRWQWIYVNLRFHRGGASLLYHRLWRKIITIAIYIRISVCTEDSKTKDRNIPSCHRYFFF